MREDYGNISLTVGEAEYEMDDGFGGGVAMDFSAAEEPPEMLREAAAAATAATEVSLEPSLLREEEAGEVAVTSHISTSLTREKFRLEAPIRDDGFGGGLEQDFMSGGLFEGGGTLFEEPATPAAAPSPLHEEGEDFLPPASPMLSEGDSRPGTPASGASALDRIAPPTLDQTPVISPPPPVEEPAAVAHEQTTLLHNEVESFALAPVEASALGRAAGGERRKRKRKLIVDEIKAISGEGMKAQLSDSADIVTTLDIAPPTKRLMHWKETGGVEELFSLPGRTLGAQNIFKTYQKCLKQLPAGAAADERFETLHGDSDREQLHLVHIGGAVERPTTPPPPKEKPTALGKRKRAAEAAESAYAKRQQELVRLQEEFAREEAARRRKKPAEISLPLPSAEEEDEEQRHMLASPLPPSAPALEETGVDLGSYRTEAAPVTPVPPQPDLFGTLIASPRAAGPPAAELTLAQQATLTEQWVSQVQPAALPEEEEDLDLGGGYEPPEYPEEGEEEPCEGEEEEEEFPADIAAAAGPADESAMQEDETIEQYEDRVLNKRAAQMHRHLAKRFEADEELDLASLLRASNRKQVAQKFYSMLVLQKVMAVEVSQSEEAPFGRIRIARGPKFESALQSL
jgi:cohesin complex subunit SCC1